MASFSPYSEKQHLWNMKTLLAPKMWRISNGIRKSIVAIKNRVQYPVGPSALSTPYYPNVKSKTPSRKGSKSTNVTNQYKLTDSDEQLSKLLVDKLVAKKKSSGATSVLDRENHREFLIRRDLSEVLLAKKLKAYARELERRNNVRQPIGRKVKRKPKRSILHQNMKESDRFDKACMPFDPTNFQFGSVKKEDINMSVNKRFSSSNNLSKKSSSFKFSRESRKQSQSSSIAKLNVLTKKASDLNRTADVDDCKSSQMLELLDCHLENISENNKALSNVRHKGSTAQKMRVSFRNSYKTTNIDDNEGSRMLKLLDSHLENIIESNKAEKNIRCNGSLDQETGVMFSDGNSNSDINIDNQCNELPYKMDIDDKYLNNITKVMLGSIYNHRDNSNHFHRTKNTKSVQKLPSKKWQTLYRVSANVKDTEISTERVCSNKYEKDTERLPAVRNKANDKISLEDRELNFEIHAEGNKVPLTSRNLAKKYISANAGRNGVNIKGYLAALASCNK